MKKLLCVVFCLLVLAGAAWAADPNEAAVEAAVEGMRQAMLKGERADLEKIPSADLIYVHSAGKVENAAQFIESIANHTDTYKKIEFNRQSVAATATTAVVMHTFDGVVVTKGQNNDQPYDVHLGVVQVWRKEGDAWKLFARKAIRIPF
ncbi:MAG: nuclear transport factor 2 family protein [Synergistaceae bacterium]|jgi:hypothetical protein|nr:nuclear transport factor 2 family protein [Synergistaceae bacterium]